MIEGKSLLIKEANPENSLPRPYSPTHLCNFLFIQLFSVNHFTLRPR